jgi:membrane-bound lytic murein transglycosylase F
LLITGAFCFSCSENRGSLQKTKVVAFDLDSIRTRGKLIAVTEFSSTNYYIYKGEPRGFSYELLKAFSDHMGIDLDIVTENHLENAVSMLETGKADLLATGIFPDSSQNSPLRFTVPVEETSRVLVQRKPRNWAKMSRQSVESNLIRNVSALQNKAVYIQEGSSRPDNPSLSFIGVPYDSEELIQLVENGEIDYAVCDENVALVNSTYYPDIDISTPIIPSRGLSWGIRKNNSARLLEELDKWIVTFRKTDTYASLYFKYFKNSGSGNIVKSDYYPLNSGKVSPWDDMIKIYSESIRWDWRLLASLICQESRFIPDVISRKGAYGLMQLMPETGRHFGIDITSSPGNNIKAGTEYIKWLHSIFDPKIPDENERTYFILAAYNAGPGHILDAMKLAEKNGNDPRKWEDNVAIWLQRKSNPLYYRDSIVKNGYFSGKESVAFVNEVLGRYRHYKNIIP